MRVFTPCLVALCLSVPAAGAPVPKERAEAEKIVGTWKMTLDSNGGTDTNLTLEFTQGGQMTIRQVQKSGQVTEYVGTYRVVGTELPYEVKQGYGGEGRDAHHQEADRRRVDRGRSGGAEGRVRA